MTAGAPKVAAVLFSLGAAAVAAGCGPTGPEASRVAPPAAAQVAPYRAGAAATVPGPAPASPVTDPAAPDVASQLSAVDSDAVTGEAAASQSDRDAAAAVSAQAQNDSP